MFKQTQLTEVRSVGSMAGYAAGINNETKERTTNEVLSGSELTKKEDKPSIWIVGITML